MLSKLFYRRFFAKIGIHEPLQDFKFATQSFEWGHESCTEQRWAALGLRWASAGLALGYGNWIYIGYKINVKLIYIGTGIW